MAYGDGVYLAAWSDSSANAYGRVISPTGELAAEDPLQITSAAGFQQPTGIVYNDDLSQFLVLWRDRRDGDAESYYERYPDVGPGGLHLAEANRYVPVWGDYGTAQDI